VNGDHEWRLSECSLVRYRSFANTLELETRDVEFCLHCGALRLTIDSLRRERAEMEDSHGAPRDT
jgi:hypothetical protein